jgi:uncharacterized protein (DUF1015 family)
VPRFEPFAALRYASSDQPGGLDAVIAPPYDVLSDADVDALEARSLHNIVHIDVPRERDGERRYEAAAARMQAWIAEGVLVRDSRPSFTLYRMAFVDETGRQRQIVGVLGGLEVVDLGAGGVLPHERTTKKASTDRLDLTRATDANLSPVWGLSLASGLTDLLGEHGEPVGSLTVDGVAHSVERVDEPARVAAISAHIGSDDVLIADGHHRYSISRTYRDETRQRMGRTDTGAELVLTFVSELVAEQLSVAAIHRVYRDIDRESLLGALTASFDTAPSGPITPATLTEMERRRSLCLVFPEGGGLWLIPRPGAFDDVRALDGAWLEHALDGTTASVGYQHGLHELHELMERDATVTAAILIRPVSVAEIERTAREGVLMPPKSTFFTPKLRTGLVIRELF